MLCLVPVFVFGRSSLCLVVSCLSSLYVMPCLRVEDPFFFTESTIIMEHRVYLQKGFVGVRCSGIRLYRWGGIVNHLRIFKKLFLNEPITLTHR